ncbi:MAG: MurR/RpiR family transcriptional regulator [Aeromicrobium sp.]|uniref:MurR/RpiR family transcriptional regulator n=1 Tax=Aeromicrobium sp. TaxID=1871063 RepID=UPI002636A3B0|nr:MurR/RpiR family transcriptional regulator [Aeromicrobium sp.]MDF1705329.1 MurR/RpiR family transcriptional regulator [Aeromicrobium sp.]
MTFHAALERHNQRLTEADRRIGSMLLADPRGAPFLRAAELARLADVHESSVVRFAQKLGFAGYIEMREALKADSMLVADRTIAMREEGEPFSLAMVVASQVEVLQRLPAKIPQERIDECVDAIREASTVWLVGHGLVLPLIEFMRNKLSRAGIAAVPVTERGLERATALAGVEAGDTVLAFALHDEYDQVARQLLAVEAAGATVVLLTDEDALMASNLPAQVIAIPRDRARHGVLVAMTAICYAIHYALVHRAGDDVRATRERIDELVKLDEPTG